MQLKRRFAWSFGRTGEVVARDRWRNRPWIEALEGRALLTQYFSAEAKAYINRFIVGGPVSDSQSVNLTPGAGEKLKGELAVNEFFAVKDAGNYAPKGAVNNLEADFKLNADGSEV